jgi:hypothetical protein
MGDDVKWTCQRCGCRLKGRKHWRPGETYLHWGSRQCGGRATSSAVIKDAPVDPRPADKETRR